METKTLEKQARKYLHENTKYPAWWIEELPFKKLLAIYYSEKRKNKNK